MVDDGRMPDDFVRRAGDERDSGAHAFPLRRAFACAGEGIRYAFASQRNLKIHLVFAVIAVRAGDERDSGAHAFPLRRAFACAGEGIRYAFASQRNLKIHLVFAVIAVVLGLVLQISQAGWLAVMLCIVLVMSLEILNTAVESVVDLVSPEWNILAKRAKDCSAGAESVVDLVSPEWNILAKRAKDCSAGAVYLAAFGSVIVACIVYLPALTSLLGLS